MAFGDVGLLSILVHLARAGFHLLAGNTDVVVVMF